VKAETPLDSLPVLIPWWVERGRAPGGAAPGRLTGEG
jgi:hypothetical protein